MPNQNAQRLWDLGYLWTMNRHEAGELLATDTELHKATMEIQSTHYQAYDDYAHPALERAPYIDGQIGPHTEQLLKLENRICGLPDVPPPMDADLDGVEDPEFREVLKSMQEPEEARGRGSWRPGCYPDIYADHCVKIHFDTSGFTRQWRDNWEEIKRRVLKAYDEVGSWLEEVGIRAEANVRMQHKRGRGWIGLAQLPGSNPACSLSLFNYCDTNYWRGIDSACQLLCHELGHNMNLGHARQSVNNVMSPYISWRPVGFVGYPENDDSRRILDRYFGGEPTPRFDQPDEPDDPDDPKPKPIVITSFEIEQPGVYQVVRPKGGDDDRDGWKF